MRTRFLTTVAISACLSTLVVPKQTLACGADPFIGSLCLVGFTFCPRGWSEANGQVLSVGTNAALFSLIGITYGGDGRTTFALPDLRSRVPIHHVQGPGLTSYQQGDSGGQETVQVTVNQMSSHTHTATLHAETAGGITEIPANNKLANSRRSAIYSNAGSAVSNLDGGSITVASSGGGQPQENRQPYLAMKYCIATIGVFPSR